MLHPKVGGGGVGMRREEVRRSAKIRESRNKAGQAGSSQGEEGE